MRTILMFLLLSTSPLGAMAQVRSAPPTEFITSINNGVVAGQYFTTWGDRLESFSFWVSAPETPVSFQAFVSEWFVVSAPEDSYPTPLYTSALLLSTGLGHQKLTFDTEGLALNSDALYFAYLRPIDGYASLGTVCYTLFLGCSQADAEYIAAFGHYGKVWEVPFVDEQMTVPVAFEAEMISTPEPATFMLLLTGILLLGLIKTRQDRRSGE